MKSKIELLKKIQIVQKELNFVLQPTKESKDFKFLPFEAILSTIQPLLHENGMLILFEEKTSDNGFICVKTILADLDTGETITSTPSITPIKLAGLSFINSRIALSTVLKRIGILEVLGIAISNENDIAAESKSEVSAKTIKTNSQEYKNLKKSLIDGEVEFETVERMYLLTPEQRLDLSSLMF